jgi:hypothetical protein
VRLLKGPADESYDIAGVLFFDRPGRLEAAWHADSKAVGGLPANGFAFVPQDRAVPPFPQPGIGRVVELGSFGFSKARLGKVTLVEWLFCDVASPEQKSMLSSCIDDKE